MGVVDVIKNVAKVAVGYQRSFEELLLDKDVSRAVSMMADRSVYASKNLEAYKIETHAVMSRKDKAIYNKDKSFKGWRKRNKIPIPYQPYINEVALVFLYGRPVKWELSTKEHRNAFSYYTSLMTDVHFDSRVREAKRVAGAEGCSAILYHVYRDDKNRPRLLLNVLSKDNGDDIYTMKDQYGRLSAFAWGYNLKESGGKMSRHVDFYTKDKIFKAKRGGLGWEVGVSDNPIGKIPALIFEQDPEAKNVHHMIERVEEMESTEGDVIDRFANPVAVATSEILNSLPEQKEEAKLIVLKNGGEFRYVTWDAASESKQNQFARLENHILTKSFTPNIDLDSMKGLGGMSAKAIRKMFLLAFIKADKHKEMHDGYMIRHISLMKAIMGNVLDYAHKSEYESMVITHKFQEPFGDDLSEMLADVSKQFNDGALSLETYVSKSYLVDDAAKEMELIKKEREERIEEQKELNKIDVFGEGE